MRPGNDEGPVLATPTPQEQTQTDHAIVPAGDAERKEFANASALAARAGCTLHELASGGYLLGRWSMCRELPDLRAVHAMLARMTGVRV